MITKKYEVRVGCYYYMADTEEEAEQMERHYENLLAGNQTNECHR